MSRGINKVILIGNLGSDPILKATPSGNMAARLSLATSEMYKDQSTNKAIKRVEWHRIILFGRLAEIAGQYLGKGSKIYIEGSIRTRKWKEKDGTERYTTEIFASDLQMLVTKPVSTISNGDAISEDEVVTDLNDDFKYEDIFDDLPFLNSVFYQL